MKDVNWPVTCLTENKKSETQDEEAVTIDSGSISMTITKYRHVAMGGSDE